MVNITLHGVKKVVVGNIVSISNGYYRDIKIHSDITVIPVDISIFSNNRKDLEIKKER